MSLEIIQAKKQILVAQRDQLLANINMTVGAITVCDELLGEIARDQEQRKAAEAELQRRAENEMNTRPVRTCLQPLPSGRFPYESIADFKERTAPAMPPDAVPAGHYVRSDDKADGFTLTPWEMPPVTESEREHARSLGFIPAPEMPPVSKFEPCDDCSTSNACEQCDMCRAAYIAPDGDAA